LVLFTYYVGFLVFCKEGFWGNGLKTWDYVKKASFPCFQLFSLLYFPYFFILFAYF